MRTLTQSALTIGVAAALLGGCAGLQPPISAPGAMPQTSAIASAQSGAHRLSASYQQLYSFRDSPPTAGLINVNGTLYGTTYNGGGRGNYGTVYSITTTGVHKVIYRFRGGSDGRAPHSELLDVNGTLYGTTTDGGGGSPCFNSPDFGCGTVYSISTSGTEKVLYAFKGGRSDGAFPIAGLIDVKGTLYGTTSGGGSGCNPKGSEFGCGTVFSVTTSGQETVLHSLRGRAEGVSPVGSLIDVNGTLYGTTTIGGKSMYGTVFGISTTGKLKVLHYFAGGSDGADPGGKLIDVNGTLYGTTNRGGGSGCHYTNGFFYGCGTVFSVTTSGQETVLYRFVDSLNGLQPNPGLTDAKGRLYGTTSGGGSHGTGAIFSITASGKEKVLYSFAGGSDGADPGGRLIDVGGTLYGTTELGGRRGHGTVFALTP